jgi:hypothetical protein
MYYASNVSNGPPLSPLKKVRIIKEYRMVFRAGLRDPCTRDVARLSESVKILEPQASGAGGAPPQRHLAPPQKGFCTPSNYTYFDLIFSYLVILITKFVKLLILLSQMPPCRPRKQVLLNIFLGLSGRCHQAPALQAAAPTPPDIYPPPRTKI